MLVVVLGLVAAGQAFGGSRSWTRVGPFVEGGGVIALSVDPSSAETLYSATEAGVFKTVDGGAHWGRSSVGLPPSSIMALVADPSSPTTLYAFSWLQGVFRSSNGGLTWWPVGAGVLPVSTFGSLVIDPEGVIFAGLFGGGVFKSADRGQTWTSQNQGLDSEYVGSIAIASSAPSTLYAVTDTGIFRTVDGGTLWTRASTLQVVGVVVDPHTSDVVYGLSSLGVSKSVDGGETWMEANTGLPVGAGAQALAIDPASSTTLYLLTSSSIFKSTDGGQTWIDRHDGVEAADLCPGAVAIVPSAPNTLYLGNQCSGGVFKTADGTASWSRTKDEFAVPGISALLSDQGSPAVFAATDRGVFRTTNMGASWTSLNSGLDDFDILTLVQAPSDSATLYVGTRSGKLYRTADGGLTWVQTAHASEWYASPLGVDPESSATLYVAEGYTLARSTDAGQSWSPVRTFDSGISALAFGGATLYLGTGGGEVWTTDDGGATWQLLHAFDSYEGISAILVDPRSPSTLYAGWIASGLAPPEYDRPGGVFKSTDSGSSWQSVEEGLGVTSLILNPANNAVLYAAAVRGQVLESLDAGASWHAAGDGLPDGWVSALTVSPLAPSTLYAGVSGAFGNGLFTLSDDSRDVHGVADPNRSTRVATRPH